MISNLGVSLNTWVTMWHAAQACEWPSSFGHRSASGMCHQAPLRDTCAVPHLLQLIKHSPFALNKITSVNPFCKCVPRKYLCIESFLPVTNVQKVLRELNIFIVIFVWKDFKERNLLLCFSVANLISDRVVRVSDMNHIISYGKCMSAFNACFDKLVKFLR